MARRNVGRYVPYLKVQQSVCHPNRRNIPCPIKGKRRSFKYPCLARNIDEGLFEKPVSELGIQLLKENPSTGAEKAMTQCGPIRRFTVAT
jgi:hypothetical protein